MGVTLFEHNRVAYESALALMKTKKKAAVIHPTGTGKSFLAFQLCADYRDCTVCWLSPSEYIYHTQEENWRRAGGCEIKNVLFFTYARLMLMNEEELGEIQPDYIVLDEFHRCGAKMWGQGVQRLLSKYPSVPLLGLSATNIRYLDRRRDMAEELFAGCVASELTLGEAIVRGILNPPKYVLSVYAFQKDLERYEARVQSAKNRAVRQEAQKALEALRRALELADGMDKMFQKHMPDPCGKYIVFCANHSHMKEMIDKASEWFALVDSAPHVYSMYSREAETERAFQEFKNDKSRHLKLLFSIDMLNEGIHVEDISGVLLLRPTVSPVIYKQQIGRAFSASKKHHAVIFDIVLNIENLSGIGALKEEMQSAIEKFEGQGRSEAIVNRHFQVTDQIKDCVRLFERLEGSLSASWDVMYEAARAYREEKDSLEVPKRYVTKEGLPLGAWLDTQRRVYAGKMPGILTEEQIKKLNGLGMRWQGSWEAAWERNFAEAKSYYQKHGNLLVKAKEMVHGVALGQWLAQLRVYKKKQVPCLTQNRIAALDGIGMVWDVSEYLWEQNYDAALRYYRTHGNLDAPGDYVDEEGVSLGRWLAKMRRERQAAGTGEDMALKFARLDALGMIWESKWDVSWEKSYDAAVRYQKSHGDLNIPVAYITQEGIRLGKWIRRQRESKGAISRERRQKLDFIGMEWGERK
ncbi:MAG: DNA/RNA helicase [Lachnospiraceae bacterium]|nr:DNA/RNA helicase [Lachnospiraceae bacterium]